MQWELLAGTDDANEGMNAVGIHLFINACMNLLPMLYWIYWNCGCQKRPGAAGGIEILQ